MKKRALVQQFHHAQMTGVLQNDEARYKNFFGRYLPGGDLYQVPEGPTRESLRRTPSSSDDIESVFGLFTHHGEALQC